MVAQITLLMIQNFPKNSTNLIFLK